MAHDLAPWESESSSDALLRRLDKLPEHVRDALLEKIATMLDVAEAVLLRPSRIPSATPQHASLQ
jgi:hypothetical protein